MADDVLYIRGVDRQFGPPDDDVIDGLRFLVTLNLEDFQRLCAEIRKGPLFLSRKDLASICEAMFPGENGEKLGAAISWMNRRRLRNPNLTVVFQALSKVERQDSEERAFSEGEIQLLKERVELLFRDAVQFDLQAKAQKLASATGLPLEDVQIVCDFRPVFDADRNEIKGGLLVSTMRIVCEGVDGLPVSLDITLSESDVNKLSKIALQAQQKLNRLRVFVENSEIPIPKTYLNKVEESDVEGKS